MGIKRLLVFVFANVAFVLYYICIISLYCDYTFQYYKYQDRIFLSSTLISNINGTNVLGKVTFSNLLPQLSKFVSWVVG